MTAAAETQIQIAGLGRIFPDGTQALEDVSLDIEKRTITTLLGPSGCGKSTLLRLLSGLDTPTTGSIDWRNGPPQPGEIGYVFQNATLMPWASVWENIYLPFRIKGVSRNTASEAIGSAIQLVALNGFEQHRPHQLSGGMQMRVSIARALATSPSLLLMDEPFGALDEITRFRLNDELLQIQSAIGCTIVFVTHSLYEAAYLSDQIAVMSPRPGKIIETRNVSLSSRESSIRSTAEFAELCGTLSALLSEGDG